MKKSDQKDKFSMCGSRNFSSFLMILFVCFQLQADTLIAANDDRINYYGRFDFTDPEGPRCSWSGAIIEASFPGPTIGMRMEHTNAFYDVEIDGKLDTIIATGSEKDFIFRKDLSLQTHTVRILLRSENHYGAGTFLGLYLENGKILSTPPDKPIRKIEFIGDSYTAGYGIESTSRSCSSEELNKYTNANQTFAALVTRAFHSQSIILGWSGAGMVRNYGESGKRSSQPFPAHYDQTLGDVWDGGNWDYTQWKPDLVVINLGTNDYSTTPNPDDSMYIGDYHKFIARVFNNYPDVSVLCVSTSKGSFENNVQKIVAEENSTYNHPKVYFAPYPEPLELTGCDWHPSINDNVKIASALVDTIMQKLSWDTTMPVSSMRPHVAQKSETPGTFSATIIGKQLQLHASGSIAPGTTFCLINQQGKILHRATVGYNRTCTFRTDRLCPGIYLAGNNKIGWKNVLSD